MDFVLGFVLGFLYWARLGFVLNCGMNFEFGFCIILGFILDIRFILGFCMEL